MMKFQGFRLPLGMVRDISYISNETGMSKSQMVRNGLSLIINDYFQKEKVKQDQIQQHQRRTTAINGGGISLPDGW